MKAIVTCGPGFEPIDEVRRITNFSTGELGVRLSESLTRAGFEVFCLKGSGATHPDPDSCAVHQFDTNEDLLALLTEIGARHEISAVFHAAALCDYRVQRVTDAQGRDCPSAKIPSRSGALTITLEPATKVLGRMRSIFPHSLLVGWKYELTGTRGQALSKAAGQIEENHSDACVLNGRAYGSGFAFCRPGRSAVAYRSRSELISFLTAWLTAAVPEQGFDAKGQPPGQLAAGQSSNY